MESVMLRAWIALGSNLGDRQASIRAALDRIAALPGVRVIAVSSLHETAPVGGPPGQGAYLNAAAEVTVESTGRTTPAVPEAVIATELLESLLRIERSLGRIRHPADRNMPRTIDLDLLLAEVARESSQPAAPDGADAAASVGDRPGPRDAPRALLLRLDQLELPHPRLHERRFVLEPLAEIAPRLRHPSLGATVAELLAALGPPIDRPPR